MPPTSPPRMHPRPTDPSAPGQNEPNAVLVGWMKPTTVRAMPAWLVNLAKTRSPTGARDSAPPAGWWISSTRQEAGSSGLRKLHADMILPGRPGYSLSCFIRLISPGKAGRRRRGHGLVEVLTILAVVGFFLLWVLMALPRWRETARMAGCQKNLMQIGVALQLYHQANRQYPTVAPLGVGTPGDSTVKAMLDTLVLPDFLDLKGPDQKPKPSRATPPGVRVPGLACPSDPWAMAGRFAAPLSYRANTGDAASGLGGPFEPGRVATSAAIEAADGLSFTAAFAERLVGDGRDGEPGPMNYATAPGPIGDDGCPDAPAGRWRGDAGSTWAEAGWRATLYNHALAPAAPRSCVAEDGRTAAIGASSSHANRINVLLMDGSLRGVTPTMSPAVWKALGTVGTAPPTPAK